MREYRALILNDYEHARYAEWVKTGQKTIETRIKKIFSHRGDLVICCNPYEIDSACIGWDIDRKSHLLRNWRHFSRDFDFAPQATLKNFQGIFRITIPDDVEIIPRPDIKAFEPGQYQNVFVPAEPNDKWDGANHAVGRIPFDNRIDARGNIPEDF